MADENHMTIGRHICRVADHLHFAFTLFGHFVHIALATFSGQFATSLLAKVTLFI
jgi:hypothetical protein